MNVEALEAYLAPDRREAIARQQDLPHRAHGAVLFADISGFTPLAESLAQELGPRYGAEELSRHLNQVFEGLISQVERFGGSVISFSGDAITCWFDQDTDGLRATASGLAMQPVMGSLGEVRLPSGKTRELA